MAAHRWVMPETALPPVFGKELEKMYTERRRFQKVILSMLLSLVMAVTMIPGFAFAESAAVPSASAARMQVPQNLEDYTGLQQGTTSVRIYMLNCGELETFQ